MPTAVLFINHTYAAGCHTVPYKNKKTGAARCCHFDKEK